MYIWTKPDHFLYHFFLKNCQIFIRECEEFQLRRIYLKRFFTSFQHIPQEKERCCKCFVLSEAHSFLTDGFQRKSSTRPCIVQKAEHDLSMTRKNDKPELREVEASQNLSGDTRKLMSGSWQGAEISHIQKENFGVPKSMFSTKEAYKGSYYNIHVQSDALLESSTSLCLVLTHISLLILSEA